MYSAAATNIITDIDFAIAHSVAESVARMTVYNDFTAVHSISNGILTVSAENNFSAVQIAGKVVARRSVNLYCFSLIKSAPYIALTVDIADNYLVF